jgi:hypothetical protein
VVAFSARREIIRAFDHQTTSVRTFERCRKLMGAVHLNRFIPLEHRATQQVKARSGSWTFTEAKKERLTRLKIFNARSTFAVLQLLDVLTTLAAFHVGAFEVNPIVARFTVLFGRFNGVLLSKLIALALALGVRKRLWVVNLFYVGVICWNLIVVVALSLRK